MAADMSGAGGAPNPSWWQVIATALGLIGAPVLFQKMVEHLFGHKRVDAESELMLAQARKADREADDAQTSHASEFEKAVNDRVRAVLDSWERQVMLLTAQITAQNVEIRDLQKEVIDLRKALDAATKEVHALRANPGLGI